MYVDEEHCIFQNNFHDNASKNVWDMKIILVCIAIQLCFEAQKICCFNWCKRTTSA